MTEETQEDLLALIETQQQAINGLTSTVGNLLDMAKMAHLKTEQHDKLLMMPRRKRLSYSLSNSGEILALAAKMAFQPRGRKS